MLKPESLPEGFSADRAEKRVAVKANGESAAEFLLTVPPRPRDGAPLKLSYALDGTPWRGEVTLPIRTAQLIPARKTGPDFRLDNRSRLHSLTGADPALLHRLWSGPEDLSAAITLERASGNFVLKAAVTDDRHAQPFPAAEAWKGDSVQFALQLPGQNGFWELCLSLSDSGKAELTIPRAPRGYDPNRTAASGTCRIVREGTETRYELRLPDRALGLAPQLYRQGFRFNLLVNDNDGEGRDGWLQLAPGIGDEKDPGKFPVILFE